MEKESRETKLQKHEPADSLKCPRCKSLDTKFRYYNNNRVSQPRYHCRNCRRQWTLGGEVRSLRSAYSKSSPLKPLVSSGATVVGESSGANGIQPVTTNLPEALAPSNSFSGANGIQPVTTNLPEPLASLNSFNDEVSCLDVIQWLIHSDLMDQNQASMSSPKILEPNHILDGAKANDSYHLQNHTLRLKT